jgi:hypothetical protein
MIFKLKIDGGEDLPYWRSGTGVVHCTLKFDVHVRNDATPQTRHLAGSEADRNYTGVVAVVDIPDAGRSKIISIIEIVMSEWLHPYNLCVWPARAVPSSPQLLSVITPPAMPASDFPSPMLLWLAAGIMRSGPALSVNFSTL